MFSIKLIFCVLICMFTITKTDHSPFVITTWEFTNATIKAWDTVFNKHGSALDAIEDGCKVCEVEQCDGTVGYGGSPDENGETTLDAMIMDGVTMNIGAVAALRNIKSAISVARHVLERTTHTMLVGDQATQFAIEMGFQQESLSTQTSKDMWRDWKSRNCQPNFWTNVLPSPLDSCGPYAPIGSSNAIPRWRGDHKFGTYNHDTIGMVVIDSENKIAAGTSTNGARHKIPGRVGDSPIPGAGAYADDEVGGAAATGDGDVMMRFLPSFLAVEGLRNKLSPTDAAQNAISRITKHYPNFMGGIVVVDKDQNFGAACENVPGGYFPFSVYKGNSNEVEVHRVACK